MAKNITEVRDSRKKEREGSLEERKVAALEHIADELTAFRSDFNGYVSFLGAVNRGGGKL